MKNNSKGFTLIEIIAVVVIIGIILLIAIPAVSNYIVSSRKTSYISSIKAYLETARAEYEMKYYGSFLYDDEIMIVPIELIKLEKGDGGSTPFGIYEAYKNYVVIVPERNSFQYYANFMDSAGYGVNMLPSNSLSRENIEQIGKENVVSYFNYAEGIEMPFIFKGKSYYFCEDRISTNTPDDVEAKIMVLCEDN